LENLDPGDPNRNNPNRQTLIVVFAHRPKISGPKTRPANSLPIVAKSWKTLASKCRIGDAMAAPHWTALQEFCPAVGFKTGPGGRKIGQ
jgi:hypothetical protein